MSQDRRPKDPADRERIERETGSDPGPSAVEADGFEVVDESGPFPDGLAVDAAEGALASADRDSADRAIAEGYAEAIGKLNRITAEALASGLTPQLEVDEEDRPGGLGIAPILIGRVYREVLP